ncbi:phosphotransferase family protein [Paenibacillus sp. sgz500992]|uniref:phosphotransferase family protein n=1 Tax=Paenibacillus sp. sgz500992 TaxID=3242476 RepID=UPI0036D32C05
MKESWERTEQPVSLELKQIKEIVEPVFSGKRVTYAEAMSTGFRNSNYKITVEGMADPFVLRLYREDGRIAYKELAIAGLISPTVPVANFIHVDTSCTIFNQPWAVQEWKQGIHLRDVLKTGTALDVASAAASIGRVLNGIHNYTFPEFGFFGKDLRISEPFNTDAEGFLAFVEDSLFHKPCGSWLGDELTQAVWSFCQSNLAALKESRSHARPVLVHSDFNGLNILMQRDAADCSVSAVLDWEFAFSWNRYVDIGNILRYEAADSVFEKHFIAAYQEHGTVLDKNWRLLSKLEDLIALCELLNHSSRETPNRIRDLQQLIANTVLPFR